MSTRALTTTYEAFWRDDSIRQRVRAVARAGAVWVLSKRPRRPWREGLNVLYYHHVFDDERAGFDRQLRFLSDQVEWVSLDEALNLMKDGGEPGRRYLAITFDDGFENCFTHAMPSLSERSIPAAFFLPTDFVGAHPNDDPARVWSFFRKTVNVPFMTWSQCREAAAAGFAFGSHTCSHASLIELDKAHVRWELETSRKIIERELGTPCEHFCAPRGKSGLHFDASRDPKLVHETGFRSFLTTEAGINTLNQPFAAPLVVRRCHAVASWGNHELAHFLGR